ncbi:triose-phosphate isomerase [Ignavibacteria bacterium]|nr:triose-phosphate isomerase [Bacteroidota bacterium]MCZ2133761.1 triose-phosphate isomerase [Bacteroidota bacterium]
MSRTFLVAGNWKMNTLPEEAESLVRGVISVAEAANVNVAIIPPFVYLFDAVRSVQGSSVAVGAQNCHYEKKGAFTGEISAEMLAAAGCRYTLAGHSERRLYFGESDEIVVKKTLAILDAGMTVIACVGETLNERQAGNALKVVERQVDAIVSKIDKDAFANVAIAYEPVWAIGTGLAATPEQAQEVHKFIRTILTTAAPDTHIPILYGGSVTDANATELFAQPDIDGALVGGASLKADVFGRIIAAADKASS